MPVISLRQFLADIHARGARVLEHPDYGGVTPGLHMVGSMHYLGRAGDINFGPVGMPASERTFLLWVCRLADAAGLNVIYSPYRIHPIGTTAANHWDHAHVDDGRITAYVPPPASTTRYYQVLAERPVSGGTVSNPGPSTPDVAVPNLPGAPAPLDPLEEFMASVTEEEKARLLAGADAAVWLQKRIGGSIQNDAPNLSEEVRSRADQATADWIKMRIGGSTANGGTLTAEVRALKEG